MRGIRQCQSMQHSSGSTFSMNPNLKRRLHRRAKVRTTLVFLGWSVNARLLWHTMSCCSSVCSLSSTKSLSRQAAAFTTSQLESHKTDLWSDIIRWYFRRRQTVNCACNHFLSDTTGNSKLPKLTQKNLHIFFDCKIKEKKTWTHLQLYCSSISTSATKHSWSRAAAQGCF